MKPKEVQLTRLAAMLLEAIDGRAPAHIRRDIARKATEDLQAMMIRNAELIGDHPFDKLDLFMEVTVNCCRIFLASIYILSGADPNNPELIEGFLAKLTEVIRDKSFHNGLIEALKKKAKDDVPS